MITVNVKNKEIDVSKISSYIVKDTHGVDNIAFNIDEYLTGMNVFMLYTNSEGKGYIDLLEHTEDGYVWTPTHRATVKEGIVAIQLVAMSFDSNGVTDRWSSLATQVNVQKNIEADELVQEPVQTVLEDMICEAIG